MADIWLQRFFVNTANKNTCQCKHRTACYNERNGACSREERGLGFTQAPWQELRCWMLPVHHVQEIRARMDQTHTHYLKTHHNYIHIALAVLAGNK